MARVRLRPIRPEDAEQCYLWVTDPDVGRYLGLVQPPVSVEQERAWIVQVMGDQCQRHFVIEDEGGRPVGTCGLRGIDPFEHTAHLGVLIGSRHDWGRGYGTAATRALLEYAFDQLHLESVRLSCHRDNRRALRLYQKLGFQPSRHQLPKWTFGRLETRLAMTRHRWEQTRGPRPEPRAEGGSRVEE